MNTKRVKKLAALGLAAVMLLGYGNARAMAADRVTINATFCGSEVNASLAYVADTATNVQAEKCANATTRFSRGGGSIYAKAEIFYRRGTGRYGTASGMEEASVGGVGAYARVQLYGAEVAASRGTHMVSCNEQLWLRETEMGAVDEFISCTWISQ